MFGNWMRALRSRDTRDLKSFFLLRSKPPAAQLQLVGALLTRDRYLPTTLRLYSRSGHICVIVFARCNTQKTAMA